MRSGHALVLRISDQKAIVVIVVDGMTNVDLATTELHSAYFVQLVARIDTLIFGHVLVFTIAAGRGNHGSPLVSILMGQIF